MQGGGGRRCGPIADRRQRCSGCRMVRCYQSFRCYRVLVQSLILAEYLCVAVFLAFDEEVLILDAYAGLGRQGVGDEDV